MNDEKKNQIRHSLEYAKQKLEQLKENNPNENYSDLELMIEKMNLILNEEAKVSTLKIVFKLFIFSFLAYLFCTISVAVAFGFSSSLLNNIPSFHFFTILPLTALIYFLGLRVMNFISNRATHQPLFSMLIFGVIFVICVAFLDNLCFQICETLDKSFLMSSILFVITLLTDLFVTQKMYLKI
ncbi:MAG: hypothetical protein NC310_00985 [Roseburia sp.]|nr:hypothetical protein [Anaeroplasma bactoclasticum]MCM1195628.1 hypothetical protein [Roseburia sp.]MCM1556627.1 hypothetical protein [Anaeroplasma bactoclasticum]